MEHIFQAAGSRRVYDQVSTFMSDPVVSQQPTPTNVAPVSPDQVLGMTSLLIEGIVGAEEIMSEEKKQDIVTNLLQAFGGSVVEG